MTASTSLIKDTEALLTGHVSNKTVLQCIYNSNLSTVQYSMAQYGTFLVYINIRKKKKQLGTLNP